MTARDYEVIAGAFSQARLETAYTLGSFTTLRVAAEKVAGVLAVDNPRFNRIKFLDRCGLYHSWEGMKYYHSWEAMKEAMKCPPTR